MPTTSIPGLRSPHDTVGGIVYFGRMLDKIRLHAQGQLPAEWAAAIGTASPTSFDARCCRFLGVAYEPLQLATLQGASDDELLAWAFAHGRRPTEEAIEIWNSFMTKRGWRDSATTRVHERLAELGLPPGAAETIFEVIDLDEGRGAASH